MLTVSRRGLLALGGTGVAGVALAACGKAADERSDASQSELLGAEADAETALAAAYAQAATAFAPGTERTALEAFSEAASKRAEALGGTTAGNGSDAPAPDGGPDSAEALDGAARAANTAIAAHREAAGLLDTVDGRALASSSLAACAAELAAVDHFAGKREAPVAFVTGATESPYEATAEQDQSETTSTTSTTSTPSTTTEAQ